MKGKITKDINRNGLASTVASMFEVSDRYVRMIVNSGHEPNGLIAIDKALAIKEAYNQLLEDRREEIKKLKDKFSSA